MKTIQELNNKWWYRLLKVIFIGIISVSFIISVVIIASEYKPTKIKDYKINCISDYTNKKSFFAEKDANIYFYLSGTDTVYKALSTDDKKKIREACDISDDEANAGNQKAIAYIKEKEASGLDQATIQKYIDDNLRPYTMLATERTEGSYAEIIGYSLLSLLVTLIIAEIIRRTFYYIILGKIKPEK